MRRRVSSRVKAAVYCSISLLYMTRKRPVPSMEPASDLRARRDSNPQPSDP